MLLIHPSPLINLVSLEYFQQPFLSIFEYSRIVSHPKLTNHGCTTSLLPKVFPTKKSLPYKIVEWFIGFNDLVVSTLGLKLFVDWSFLNIIKLDLKLIILRVDLWNTFFFSVHLLPTSSVLILFHISCYTRVLRTFASFL